MIRVMTKVVLVMIKTKKFWKMYLEILVTKAKEKKMLNNQIRMMIKIKEKTAIPNRITKGLFKYT